MTEHNHENRTRVLGRIGKVWFGPNHDHGGCPTFEAHIEGIGGTQGFQLTFDDDAQMRAFARDFCAAFDVADVERLVNRECYALRCFSQPGECIEGIEAADTGKRITRTAWWRANVDPSLPSPLQQAEKSIRDDIARLRRRVEEEERRLATLASCYISWDTPSAADVLAENGIRFGLCGCAQPKRAHPQSTFCATCDKVIPQ